MPSAFSNKRYAKSNTSSADKKKQSEKKNKRSEKWYQTPAQAQAHLQPTEGSSAKLIRTKPFRNPKTAKKPPIFPSHNYK